MPMKCYNPRLAFKNPDGGKPIFTKYMWSNFIHDKSQYTPPQLLKHPSGSTEPLKMPCGKCEACRLEHARQRAVRCMHEFKTHNEVGCFLTLTYDQTNIPKDGSYNERHIIQFVKDLRSHLAPKKIKTFGCAEYGEKNDRPHFHLLIFGFDFPDRYYWRGSSEHGSGHLSYRSSLLENLWTYGHSEIGTLTMDSASYVARYTQKKCKKNNLNNLPPEKPVCISRRPGIGHDYFQKFYSDFYSIDAIIINGQKQGIPRYYDKLLEKLNPQQFQEIKLDREEKRPHSEPNNTTDRMKVRKVVHQQQLKRLRRTL